MTSMKEKKLRKPRIDFQNIDRVTIALGTGTCPVQGISFPNPRFNLILDLIPSCDHHETQSFQYRQIRCQI